MFDLGWLELLVIGITALIVVGPKSYHNFLGQLVGFLEKLKQWQGSFHSVWTKLLMKVV